MPWASSGSPGWSAKVRKSTPSRACRDEPPMRHPYYASDERARREKNRFVWVSRAPFLIAALCGGGSLIAMKLLAFDQVAITATACAIIVAYWAIVASMPVLRIREDQ